jgi:hypothetical protein
MHILAMLGISYGSGKLVASQGVSPIDNCTKAIEVRGSGPADSSLILEVNYPFDEIEKITSHSFYH